MFILLASIMFLFSFVFDFFSQSKTLGTIVDFKMTLKVKDKQDHSIWGGKPIRSLSKDGLAIREDGKVYIDRYCFDAILKRCPSLWELRFPSDLIHLAFVLEPFGNWTSPWIPMGFIWRLGPWAFVALPLAMDSWYVVESRGGWQTNPDLSVYGPHGKPSFSTHLI